MTELAMTLPSLEIWVIYHYPKWFPYDFILRRWAIDSGVAGAVAYEGRIAKSLEEIRRLVPEGKENLGPPRNSDPAIVEVWI